MSTSFLFDVGSENNTEWQDWSTEQRCTTTKRWTVWRSTLRGTEWRWTLSTSGHDMATVHVHCAEMHCVAMHYCTPTTVEDNRQDTFDSVSSHNYVRWWWQEARASNSIEPHQHKCHVIVKSTAQRGSVTRSGSRVRTPRLPGTVDTSSISGAISSGTRQPPRSGTRQTPRSDVSSMNGVRVSVLQEQKPLNTKLPTEFPKQAGRGDVLIRNTKGSYVYNNEDHNYKERQCRTT